MNFGNGVSGRGGGISMIVALTFGLIERRRWNDQGEKRTKKN